MRGYYSAKLSGRRLQQCYELAPPRVKAYLEAEIEFVLEHLKPDETVLELGCGYGRVAARLAQVAGRVVGIDNARDSILLARRLFDLESRCAFVEMDAVDLKFGDSAFDNVVCVQNGMFAFGVDREALVREALRVTRPGGRLFFSTYSEKFWADRLQWFQAQAAAGLLGEIDYEQTGNGTIVCKDGFRTGLATPAELELLCARLGVEAAVSEVDESSVFCCITVPSAE